MFNNVSQKKWRMLICNGILCLCLIQSISWARPPSLGIGGMLGRPQGLTLQVPITGMAAFNMSLYYDLRSPQIDLHLDQIFVQSQPVLHAFYPYFGWGGRVSFQNNRTLSNDGGLTGRIPIGLELGNSHLRGLLEVAPALKIMPALKLSVQGAIGLRYHF